MADARPSARATDDAGVVVGDFLRRAQLRLRALAAIRGATVGALVAAAAVLTRLGPFDFAIQSVTDPINGSLTERVGTSGVMTSLAALALILALVAVGAVIAVLLDARARTAARVEGRVPTSRNLILTAAELLERADNSVNGAKNASLTQSFTDPKYGSLTESAAISDIVLGRAAALTGGLRLSELFPARTATALMAVGLAALSASVVFSAGRPAGRSLFSRVDPAAAAVRSIDIDVQPPAYTGRPSERLRDPARIATIAGSQLQLTVRADAATVALEFAGASQALAAVAPGTFTGSINAAADGLLAIIARDPTGAAGTRRLIDLAATPDLPPRVRITEPARDYLLPAANRTLPITIDASDDIALVSLRLRYTKISGSGENFTFKDGEVTIDLKKNDARTWSARAAWALASLGLEKGDMVIYRAVATDGRPGAPPAESDTFIVEITAPGAVATEGFAIDDRENKYAISQQMVIVKTARLLAARASMSTENFNSASLDLAAEQRQVRAEFVFMMGGELADAGLDLSTLNEEAEAAGEADIAAGRLANSGHIDLLRAIRSMSRAAAQLADPNPAAALPIEKEALAHLQKAFSRSRYILRTLGSRERLDASRRLTGVLAALGRDSRPAAEIAPDPMAAQIRRAMADVSALAADPSLSSRAGAERLGRLAQQVRQIDPTSTHLRDAASALAEAARAVEAANGRSSMDAIFDKVTVNLAHAVQARSQPAASSTTTPDLQKLAGTLADELRKGGRR